MAAISTLNPDDNTMLASNAARSASCFWSKAASSWAASAVTFSTAVNEGMHDGSKAQRLGVYLFLTLLVAFGSAFLQSHQRALQLFQLLLLLRKEVIHG